MNNSTDITSDTVASCQHAVSIFVTTIMAIISLSAFTGNILVLVTVYRTPNLRTSTNYYYVNMAVSDFLSCLTTWPLYFTDEIITSSGSLLQGSVANFGCKVGVFFRMVSTTVSILSLVLIAVDRFVAIVFPLKATLITRNIRAALLFGTWLISIAFCFPLFHYSKVNVGGKASFCTFGWKASAYMISYVFVGLILFQIIPLIAIIILYYRIMRALRKRLNTEGNTEDSNMQRTRNKSNQNIMKIFKSIVIMLFFWFFLFGAFLILKVTFPKLFKKDRCKWILGFAYFVAPMLSTATNPVILFLFSTKFRQALSELCTFVIGKCRPYCATNISPHQGDESLPELMTFRQTIR